MAQLLSETLAAAHVHHEVQGGMIFFPCTGQTIFILKSFPAYWDQAETFKNDGTDCWFQVEI